MLIISMGDLREYRLRYNVSASAIAKKMGKSRQFVNQIEVGKDKASEEHKKAYLNALYQIVNERNEKARQGK